MPANRFGRAGIAYPAHATNPRSNPHEKKEI